MAIALKSYCFLQLKKPETGFQVGVSSKKATIISIKRYTSVSASATGSIEAISISETFNKLKKQGKVSVLIYYIFIFWFHAMHVTFSLKLE
jgi:hypothetical protein